MQNEKSENDLMVADTNDSDAPANRVHEAEPQGEAATPLSPAMLKFYQGYGPAMKMWHDVHGNTKFPIIERPDGSLKWVNRAERRRLIKRMRLPRAHNHY
jgi:hypothetical protein